MESSVEERHQSFLKPPNRLSSNFKLLLCPLEKISYNVQEYQLKIQDVSGK